MQCFRWLVLILWLTWQGLACAGEPLDLVKGYGKTQWGQSMADVKKLYPSWSGGGGGLERTRDLPSGSPTAYSVDVPDENLLGITEFGFLDDHLCSVTIRLSEAALVAFSDEELAGKLWDKYFADKEVRAQLDKAGILIRLNSPYGNQSNVSELYGKFPVDDLSLKGPKELIVSSLNTARVVQYMNRVAEVAVASQAKERREKAVKERTANIKLDEVL